MEYVPLASWGRFGVHEDDVQDVTGESDVEPMLSRNQLKVGKSFAETTTEVKSVQKF